MLEYKNKFLFFSHRLAQAEKWIIRKFVCFLSTKSTIYKEVLWTMLDSSRNYKQNNMQNVFFIFYFKATDMYLPPLIFFSGIIDALTNQQNFHVCFLRWKLAWNSYQRSEKPIKCRGERIRALLIVFGNTLPLNRFRLFTRWRLKGSLNLFQIQ